MFDNASAVCDDPSALISQLPAPEESAMEDVYAREDAEYERLTKRWQRELDRAHELGDQVRVAEVQRTLRAAHLQRQRQLADRDDYDDPPF